MSLKSVIKKSPTLIAAIAALYRLRHRGNGWRIHGSNRLNCRGAFLRNVNFDIQGRGNSITIGPKSWLRDITFVFVGDGCNVEIGAGSVISSTSFWCDEGASIRTGQFTMESGHIAATEGRVILIGNDCMFSDGIEIRNGDSHSIISVNDRKRLNPAADVIIGDHVWLTAHVRILKGSVIPSHVIIGNSSVVSGAFKTENALYAGIPAKLIKEGIDWSRDRLQG